MAKVQVFAGKQTDSPIGPYTDKQEEQKLHALLY